MFFSPKKKKILVFLGHPDAETFSGYLADRYEEGAREGGHEVVRLNLGDLKFDPILHKGYKVVQELEPDLIKVQEAFKWAEHIAIIYPIWWCAMPALLKGMFDRMFLPGFAFRFNKNSMLGRLGLGTWQMLLKGREARLIVTMNSWPFITRLVIGDYTNELRHGILWFSGITPTKVTAIGPSEAMSPERRLVWGSRIRMMGKLGE